MSLHPLKRYYQGDPRWGHEILGNNPEIWNGIRPDIAMLGCHLTCDSMYLSIYGFDYNPSQLNQEVKKLGFYGPDDGFYHQGAIHELTGLIEEVRGDFPSDLIKQRLGEGIPVIVGVNFTPNSSWTQHYVLITGMIDGNDYWIIDPAYNDPGPVRMSSRYFRHGTDSAVQNNNGTQFLIMSALQDTFNKAMQDTRIVNDPIVDGNATIKTAIVTPDVQYVFLDYVTNLHRVQDLENQINTLKNQQTPIIDTSPLQSRIDDLTKQLQTNSQDYQGKVTDLTQQVGALQKQVQDDQAASVQKDKLINDQANQISQLRVEVNAGSPVVSDPVKEIQNPGFFKGLLDKIPVTKLAVVTSLQATILRGFQYMISLLLVYPSLHTVTHTGNDYISGITTVLQNWSDVLSLVIAIVVYYLFELLHKQIQIKQ
jgi:hypothetical protein